LKLKSWFNPDPSRFMELQDSGRDLGIEIADVAFNTADMVEELKTFDEAHNHPNANHRLKWQEVISKEFNEVSAKGVWKKIWNCPMVRIVIRVNGSLKLSATEACGYSQVPGVNFHESFAPVINDVTFRILLVMMLTWNLKAKFIDIEKPFCMEI
jgi:hypothetical protein